MIIEVVVFSGKSPIFDATRLCCISACAHFLITSVAFHDVVIKYIDWIFSSQRPIERTLVNLNSGMYEATYAPPCIFTCLRREEVCVIYCHGLEGLL